ncbi:XRE family transcriptional regulator [Nocardia terpenica]|uniref:XRE family transcriptional regulator n=1 Tax=Nocardia terpenica TaxID=455432 RepID=A0A164MHU7_9NOCA|nr:XRE family transcriptional regulator [Nocardia terpenica]KZM73370.1 XRE family transcriptional regulator [Nocardia terpenica]NQE87470.1 XRE family transcriptional regulator [Nocardia terpenica]
MDETTPSLASKIEKLFKTVQPLGREYSNEEVAKGCSELGGGTFSKTYVWQLRTGQRDNPTKRHLEALAAFFRVPAAYFFDDETSERVDTQLALVAALRNSDIRNIALRALELDGPGRQSVSRIIEEITRMHMRR